MDRKLALQAGEQASHVLGIMLDSVNVSSYLFINNSQEK